MKPPPQPRALQARAVRVPVPDALKAFLGYERFCSAKRGLPLPLGRGVCETKSKNGRSRPPKPFISRVFCAQRGIETMVPEGARPWGRGRSGDCDLLIFPGRFVTCRVSHKARNPRTNKVAEK